MRFLLFVMLATRVFAEAPVPLDKPGVVRLVLRDAPAMAVLESIVSLGGYDFVAGAASESKVTVLLSGASIREALETVTKVAGLEYRLEGRIVSVYGETLRSEETKVYPIVYAPVGGPEGIDHTLSALFAGEPPAGGDSAAAATRIDRPQGTVRIQVDAERRRLVVTAVPSVHRQVAELIEELDARAGVRRLSSGDVP